MMMYLGNVQAENQRNVIVLQLKSDLSQLKQRSLTDTGVKRSLEALRKAVPEVESSLRQQAKNSSDQNKIEASYTTEQTFTVDVSDRSNAQQNALLNSYVNNGLVASAQLQPVQIEVAKDIGEPLKARSQSALEALYTKGPSPESGYVLGGINSNAARSMPGGQGDKARVIIASDNYWNRSHVDLPSLAFSPIDGPRRLSCSTQYAVGNYATAAAGIIAAKDNHAGVVGIVPQAQLAAVPATFASIYDDIYQLGLHPGDVVVLDANFSPTTSRFGDFTPYPGEVCPKATAAAKFGRTCQLPSAGYESTQRRIEILTQELKVHVIVNASGGVQYGNEPATPMNLDHPDFNGLFDRTRNDDGAIYVGSIDPKTGATLAANYGRRIDVSTWGTHIPYASYVAGGTHATYSRYDNDDALGYRFSSYIVAGAVAQIQSIAFASGLGAVPPRVMRQLLTETGHDLPGRDINHPMGKQPDVKAAVDRMLVEYARGFPPEPAPAFGIKRVVGFDKPYHGRTWDYRAIISPAGATDISYHWSNIESPLVTQGPTTANPLELAVDWSEGQARERTITLTARNSQGATDTWTRRVSVPSIVTRYDGEWNVPDEVQAGQVVTLSGKIKGLFATGQKHYYYWKAPALFMGIKEGSALVPSTHALTLTVPASLKPGTQLQVQLLGTLDSLLPPIQAARSQFGMLLSKTVTIKAPTPGEGSPGEDTGTPTPGEGSPGGETEACAMPWSRTTAYATPGTRVSYGGFNYEVAHWTQAHQPDLNFVLTGSAKPWRRVGPCGK
ncbi:S8 family peptidase [Pseudomonas poae]|nr:hypothetical protein [Pseudomonas poae]